MRARSDTSHVRKGHRQPHRAVAAHADVADVVEEDDTRSAAFVLRLAQQRANQSVISTRLVHGEAAIVIELLGEAPASFRQRPGSQWGSAFDDEPCRLAFSVAVDHPH